MIEDLSQVEETATKSTYKLGVEFKRCENKGGKSAPKSYGLWEFGVIFERVSLMCDNTRAISIAKNSVFHKRMRYLERRHHFLRDHVEKRDKEMRYIDTERKLADIFSKPLDSSRFATLQWEIGVCHSYSLVWGGVCVHLVHFLSFCFFVVFSSYSTKLTLLHLLY
jgi:hypothetical protein